MAEHIPPWYLLIALNLLKYAFLFIPIDCPTFLKYACTNTKYHKERLPEATSWCLAIVEVDIEYTDAILISGLYISKLFYQRIPLHSSKWIILYIRSSEMIRKTRQTQDLFEEKHSNWVNDWEFIVKIFFSFYLWHRAI